MEYTEENVFEDRASQSVFYMDFEKAPYSLVRENGWLKRETDALRLIYKEGYPFSADNVTVSLKQELASVWNCREDFETLGGNASTLDKVIDSILLEMGFAPEEAFLY